LLGIFYAALGALTFSLNNVTMRRGVVTGSVLQGKALTVPIGGLSFLVMAVALGQVSQLFVFPVAALCWLAGQGLVHFVAGRYCNYKSNQLVGVNLAAPVIQLQVPVALLLAVVMLHERFTVLRAIGSALMLGGSFTTQSHAGAAKKKASAPLPAATPIPTIPSQDELNAPDVKLQTNSDKPGFKPRVVQGYQWINRDHEVMNTAVFIGAGIAVLGSIVVSLPTEEISAIMRLPPSLADFLGYRLAGR
jgi:uncharacterized membrane protein